MPPARPSPPCTRSYGAPSAAQQAEALRSSVAAQFSDPGGLGSPTASGALPGPPPDAAPAAVLDLGPAAAAAAQPAQHGPRPAGGSDSSESSGEEDDEDGGERFKLGPDGPLQGVVVAPGLGGGAARGRGVGRPHGHHHEHAGLLLKDAFLVFRALCKLSIRTSDSATVQDPTALRGKVGEAGSVECDGGAKGKHVLAFGWIRGTSVVW
jgi:hypothetical protein